MLVFTMESPHKAGEQLVEYVYNHYLKNMFACAKSILENDNDAEEAVYEALTKICFSKVKIRNIETKEGLSFVLTVVKNVSIDKKRKKEKEKAKMLFYADEELLELETARTTMQSTFTAGDILEAIRELDDEYRDIMIMSAVDGLSSNEIGTLLGMKGNTVRARLAKARQILKEKLKERGIYV